MSGKLDQPLDDIAKTQRRHPHRVASGARRAVKPASAPNGGVTKNSRVRKAIKATTNGRGSAAVASIPLGGESKIIVSGLPVDVSETQIKDYFAKTIGPVRRAVLTYGPTGQSKGVATITFNKAGGAMEAAKQLNGVKVDNRPMKIEVIVGANQAAPVKAKALSDRVSQPKPATKAQGKGPKNGATRNATGKGRTGTKGRGANRGKPKNAEELDAEMTDYFDAGANGATAGDANPVANGNAQPVVNGGDAMEDEIM